MITEEDGNTWFKSDCPGHNDAKCMEKWKKDIRYFNPHSKLKTCFGGEDKLMAAYWAIYNTKNKDCGKM